MLLTSRHMSNLFSTMQLVEESSGEAKLMESLEVDFTSQGWLIIDITRGAEAWQLDHHTTKGKCINYHILDLKID